MNDVNYIDPNIYLWKPCEVCGVSTNGRYMSDDIPVCYECYDSEKLLDWLKDNRPEYYRFEESEIDYE